MGIAGAGIATVISQIVTFIIAGRYMLRFRSVKLTLKQMRLNIDSVKAIVKLGVPGFLNHFMAMVVQVTMNNTLRVYGAASVYGSDIPIAVVGVITKLNAIVTAFCIGIATGAQPICGFNYGAKNYTRVKATYKLATAAVICISLVFFACFQLFPRQLISIFGSGDKQYYLFGERYMRVYLMMVCFYGMQPLATTFFASIGKAYKALFITMTRQGIFLLPLLLILPRFLGLDGIVYAGPIADSASILCVIVCISLEFKAMSKLMLE